MPRKKREAPPVTVDFKPDHSPRKFEGLEELAHQIFVQESERQKRQHEQFQGINEWMKRQQEKDQALMKSLDHVLLKRQRERLRFEVPNSSFRNSSFRNIACQIGAIIEIPDHVRFRLAPARNHLRKRKLSERQKVIRRALRLETQGPTIRKISSRPRNQAARRMARGEVVPLLPSCIFDLHLAACCPE